jgi:hypothetical protein
MSQYESRQPSGWATGGAMFAGVMMIVVGVFDLIAGISAISKDDMFVKTPNYVFNLSVNGWGWIHLILALLVLFAGWAVLSGKVWGGMVGIAMATLVAIGNFFWIPYYPFWSILTIALAVWVIWALTRPDVYRSP